MLHQFEPTDFMLSKARDLSSGILNFECDSDDKISLALDAEPLLDVAEQIVSAFAATHRRSNAAPGMEGIPDCLGFRSNPANSAVRRFIFA